MYIQYRTLYPTSIVFCIIPYIAFPLSYLSSSHLIFLTSSSLSLFPQPLYQFCRIALILLRYSYSSLYPRRFYVPFFLLNLSSNNMISSRHDDTKYIFRIIIIIIIIILRKPLLTKDRTNSLKFLLQIL